MNTRHTIYLPALPSLSSDDIVLHKAIHRARLDLVEQLAEAGYFVSKISGKFSWLKNMLEHAMESDAFIFPSMTSLPETHPRYKAEAAQRWFEFFSLVTGIHVGTREKYNNYGVSKPCILMDHDKQWQVAIDLLNDLRKKGMFTSNVEDIVQVVHGPDFHSMNEAALVKMRDLLAQRKGKSQSEIRSLFPPDYQFENFRHDMNRHPFGVALFGSARTQEPSYLNATSSLMQMCAERGWRLITGAGLDGCMGAADSGHAKGKEIFNARYPDAPFKPAHVGVSTQDILRLEGPPKHLDQLIITDDIYIRMEIMIRGHKSSNPLRRARDATRVIFIAPGGTGTLHEFATLMQLANNGNMMLDREVVLLNFPSHLNPQEGFWDKLIETAQRLGFINNLKIASSPEEAIKIADDTYVHWLERYAEYRELPHPVLNP